MLWLVAGEKRGVSAKSVQNALGIGSYKTAWLALHKVRLAMTRTSPDKLKGVVEVDESYIGGVSPGTRGRGTKKAIIAIAVERLGYGKQSGRIKLGRARMRMITDSKKKTLEDFVTDVVAPGALIHTDANPSYADLKHLGYTHVVTIQRQSPTPAHVEMPAVHRVASLMKRWILGTHHGAASPSPSISTPTWTSSSSASTAGRPATAASSSIACSSSAYRLIPAPTRRSCSPGRGLRGSLTGPPPKPKRAATSRRQPPKATP